MGGSARFGTSVSSVERHGPFLTSDRTGAPTIDQHVYDFRCVCRSHGIPAVVRADHGSGIFSAGSRDPRSAKKAPFQSDRRQSHRSRIGDDSRASVIRMPERSYFSTIRCVNHTCAIANRAKFGSDVSEEIQSQFWGIIGGSTEENVDSGTINGGRPSKLVSPFVGLRADADPKDRQRSASASGGPFAADGERPRTASRRLVHQDLSGTGGTSGTAFP